MKKTIFIALSVLGNTLSAQEKPAIPFSRNTEFNKSEYNNFSSKKETLLEKQIVNIGKIGDLNFQKITLKDNKDNASISVLGIMTFFENFDSISKRTITFEKEEVKLLISNLQALEQKTSTKPSVETKYKYTTKNNLEAGSTFDLGSNSWVYFFKLPNYNLQNATVLDKDEFKELINILKKTEKDL